MTKEKHIRGRNLDGNLKSGDDLPKFNWEQHAHAHNDFLCQNKFLNSNFLFSLPTQKVCEEEQMGSRSLFCQLQNIRGMQNAEVEKAWRSLSNIRLSSRNYTKPGKTIFPVKGIGPVSNHGVKRTTPSCMSAVNGKSSVNMQTHQNTTENVVRVDESNRCLGNSFPSGTTNLGDSRNMLHRQKEGHASVVSTSDVRLANNCSSIYTSHVSRPNGSEDTFTDAMDDESILEALRVGLNLC